MKLKIRKWILYTELERNSIPYIIIQPDDVSDDEFALCVQEQIYGDKLK